MLWTNKLKDERRSSWHTSRPPSREAMSLAHRWCTNQMSTGLFYYHYTNSRWWFERKEDAVIFALKFGN